MKTSRCWMVGCLSLVAVLAGWKVSVGQSFDKLSDADRKAFGVRFEKEVWPLMTRNGKDGCVGCHSGKIVSALTLSGKADKDFPMLLREGFFLPDDPGSVLGRITDNDPKRRMPFGKPAWDMKDVKVLQAFMADLNKAQKK